MSFFAATTSLWIGVALLAAGWMLPLRTALARARHAWVMAITPIGLLLYHKLGAAFDHSVG